MCKETYSIWVDFIVQLEHQQSSITDLLKVWWTTSSKSDLRKLFLRLKNKSSNCNYVYDKKKNLSGDSVQNIIGDIFSVGLGYILGTVFLAVELWWLSIIWTALSEVRYLISHSFLVNI